MKKHSCGALLFTLYNNEIHIVLGMEKNEWFPFKGTKEPNESLKETAIREIYEETCGIVNLNNIYLNCNYSTKRKYYHIGLVFVNINILKKFYGQRNKYKNKEGDNFAFLEKSCIKLFNINELHNYKFHSISLIPINYYKEFLFKLQTCIQTDICNNNINNYYLKQIQPTDIQKSPNISILVNKDTANNPIINNFSL